ncbi:ROK family protein [Candidatus Peregrinibacteria bacterium]|nr:ROK family protein [Candidatus Peregrinibacteria bacterium]
MKKQIKYIGIDIGGTKILLQTFDEKLNIIDEVRVKTNTKSHNHFIKSLYELIDSVFQKSIKGIGVAVPGIVNIKKGTLVKAPHLPTKRNTELKKLLEKKYNVKVHIENDINAFLAGQYSQKGLQKYKNIIAIMVGTGVGSAIMINGKIIYGKDGYAGEVGHIIINSSSNLKTLEQNTSGHHISKIAKILNPKSKITGSTLGDMLKQKNQEAKKILNYLTENLAIGLSNLNLIFNPEAIILGGSVYNNFISRNKKKLTDVIKKNSLDKSSPKLIDAKNNELLPKGTIILLKNN